MKQLKNRTLALVLASVVTVVGAFGAENYKNSLMSLKFDSGTGGAVNVTLMTKFQDETPVSQKKIDSDTYVIVLPEVDGKSAPTPVISGDISSVNIKTMPYTTNGKGYTKITIKTTSSNVVLNTKKALYIEDKSQDQVYIPTRMNEEPGITEQEILKYEPKPVDEPKLQRNTEKPQNITPSVQESVKQFESPKNTDEVSQQTSQVVSNQPSYDTEDDSGKLLFILGILTVIIACIYLFIRGKNKMVEVLGEQPNFSFDDDDKPKKNKKDTKSKQIRKKINELDKMYAKPFKMPVKIDDANTISDISDISSSQDLEIENNVVDLDELFQDINNNFEDKTNDALDDFLNSFGIENHEEEELRIIQEEENAILNELFEKYIVNGTIKFSKNDVEKINELLNSEINDETLKNISEYAVSNPIKPRRPNHAEILENLITTYTINQNLSFSKDDVDALNKLINVEIDSDFITDLTTNPERTKIMQKEIESRQVVHKNHEILTLNVKDMLPDLSEALKKQGGRRIESEVKPQTVYYSEGYDVSTLSVSDDLPDLVLDLDNPEFNKYRPSDKVEYAETGYDVQTLSIRDELPDLADAAEHPDKYNEKKNTVKVDEDLLLKNISNVTFKPFYDGSKDIEILNTFEEATEDEKVYINEPVEYTDTTTETVEKISESSITAKVNETKICTVDGEKYEIISTSKLNDNIGCHLAKNERGYTILGYIGDKIFKIKYYENIKSQKIQSRLNEKLEDGKAQYIVRIGLHKFILNISEDNMEYVMDLC